MNLFFGKISMKYDIKQISDGYYISPKNDVRFGGIEIGDYTFIIGGGKIQFWQAREWGEQEGKECLHFKIINDDLGLSIPQFTALNFFKLNKALLVLTSRSSKKAFFKLDSLQQLPIDYLADSQTYKNDSIYRKVIIHQSSNLLEQNSLDIQLYYENQELKLNVTDFFTSRVANNFKDNLSYEGRGSRNKDTAIRKLKAKITEQSASFTYQELSIRALYDLLFCEYKVDQKYYLVGTYWDGSNPTDQTDRFLSESIWENGHDGKHISTVKAIPVGSLIAIRSLDKKNSIMHVRAIGEVSKNHKDGNLLDVEWEEEFKEFSLPFTGGYWSTINEITKLDHIDAIWNHTASEVVETPILINPMALASNVPLNQILFGPPGTGKTYHTIDMALAIADPSFYEANKEADRALLLERFKTLSYNPKEETGQIGFVTFHQSMNYEDFIEGIKPLKPENKDKPVQYDVVSGIFKKIASLAASNYQHSKQKNQQKLSFEEALGRLKEEWEDNPDLKFPLKTSGYDYTITDFNENSIPFKKASGGQAHGLSISSLKELYYETRTVDFQTGIWRYYLSVLNKLKSYTQISSQKVQPKNYVLIIDEINRGNVSSIFGELITLLEENKRQGKKESLEIMLPYSQEPFSVPKNLYIIGTMNTADRSVEALDTALRRRFSFKEMPPKSRVISQQENKGVLAINEVEIDLALVLETMNKRIEVLLDRDHLIGHSYFLNIDNSQQLKATFENNIIPLLQEYFYGDYAKIALVLGEGFCAKKQITDFSTLFASLNNYDTSMYQEKRNYELLIDKEGFELSEAIRLLLNTATKEV